MQGVFNEARIRNIVYKNHFELKKVLMKPKSNRPTKIEKLTIKEEKIIKELDKGCVINIVLVFTLLFIQG